MTASSGAAGTRQLLREVFAEHPLEAGFAETLDKLVALPTHGIQHARLKALPLLACEASGGDSRRAQPIAEAWQHLYLAAKLLDDVIDEEPDSAPREAIIAAVGLISLAALALEILPTLHVPADRLRPLVQRLHRSILLASGGQHADISLLRTPARQCTADDWLQIARAKSGEALAWATWAGAWVAGASKAQAEAYHSYGIHLGILLQVADDFKEVWEMKVTPRLVTERPSLPFCYARTVLGGEEWNHLAGLLRLAEGGDTTAYIEVLQELDRIGAREYLLVVGQAQRNLAQQALREAGCDPVATPSLWVLLDNVFPSLEILDSSNDHGS